MAVESELRSVHHAVWPVDYVKEFDTEDALVSLFPEPGHPPRLMQPLRRRGRPSASGLDRGQFATDSQL